MNDIACEPTKATGYSCPQCSETLHWLTGSKMRPTMGVTMFCLNKNCPAQEITGYGTTLAAAFKIITEKYGKARAFAACRLQEDKEAGE